MRNLRIGDNLNFGQILVLELLRLFLETGGRIHSDRIKICVELLALFIHEVLLLIQILDSLI